MADDFFSLSKEDQLQALAVASDQSGRPAHLLEKDVWVVWTLRQLFDAPFAEHLVFKGGTSLSKAYHAIDRFSEDIDITYDIRAIAPDLVGDAPDALPKNRSQQSKWTDEIRKRLVNWVATTAQPYLQGKLSQIDPALIAAAAGDAVTIAYSPLAKGSGYVGALVKVEFGARSTGEPFAEHKIAADAAAYLETVRFPECTARVMRAERTFWEKATAMHVFCCQAEPIGDRFARHWSDLVALDKAGFATRALADKDLAKRVADHKTMFFREKDAADQVIDYRAAVSGKLKLVPEGAARTALAADYAKMIEDGLLSSDADTFDAILDQCADIERRANK